MAQQIANVDWPVAAFVGDRVLAQKAKQKNESQAFTQKTAEPKAPLSGIA
jgi:hypothetical protein